MKTKYLIISSLALLVLFIIYAGMHIWLKFQAETSCMAHKEALGRGLFSNGIKHIKSKDDEIIGIEISQAWTPNVKREYPYSYILHANYEFIPNDTPPETIIAYLISSEIDLPWWYIDDWMDIRKHTVIALYADLHVRAYSMDWLKDQNLNF
jgi:hypothetical protein